MLSVCLCILKSIGVLILLVIIMYVIIKGLYARFNFQAIHLLGCGIVFIVTFILGIVLFGANAANRFLNKTTDKITSSLMKSSVLVDEISDIISSGSISSDEIEDVTSQVGEKITANKKSLGKFFNVNKILGSSQIGEEISSIIDSKQDLPSKVEDTITVIADECFSGIRSTIRKIRWSMIISITVIQLLLLFLLINSAKKSSNTYTTYQSYDSLYD